MFATLSIPTLLATIQDISNQESLFIDLLTFLILFAHPYMILRLVRHFQPLPNRITQIGKWGFLPSIVALILAATLYGSSDQFTPLILLTVLFAISYFIFSEGYTALKFILGAFKTSGLTRHRLRFLGGASAFLAAIFANLLLSFILQAFSIPYSDDFLSGFNGILAILIGICYLLGLTPPHFLRRYWQLSELQFFLDKINTFDLEQPPQQLLDLLSLYAVRAVGGSAGTTAHWQPETKDFLLVPPEEYDVFSGLQIPDGGNIGRSWHTQTAILLQETSDYGPGDQQAAAQVKANALAVVPIRVLEKPFCLLLVFLPYRPLFPGDDLALLNLFANRVSIALAFAPLLEHERNLVQTLKKRTTELQEAHDTLEQRVQERTAEIAAVNDELKQFIYIVSHDLRSPLVNLRGFVSEMNHSIEDIKALKPKFLPQLDEADQKTIAMALDEDIAEAIEFINVATLRMDKLVMALLDLSRLGRRSIFLEPVDMNEIVADTLKTLGHVIVEKGVTVQTDPLPTIQADLLSIEQITSNLLTNAVNYLDPERPGRLIISATQEPDSVTIHFKDNGRGIAPADHEKIFAPFRRAGNQDVPGDGMGLAHVQALVRSHNGRISFDSQSGSGTTFHLTLPK
jgi:signal transduction histidine kinase